VSDDPEPRPPDPLRPDQPHPNAQPDTPPVIGSPIRTADLGDATESPTPSANPGAVIELAPTRRLLGAAFELLGRSSDDMRRASFYIGSIMLGTAGPLVLAAWAINVIAVDHTFEEMGRRYEAGGGAALTLLVLVAGLGAFVAVVESRNLASSVLGARYAGRPITPRQALARSRMVFWRAVAVGVIVAVPLAIAQAVVSGVVDPLLGGADELSIVTTTLVTATIGAPFAYVLAGVVLGDVNALESVRRSIRLFRARKLAAAIVVTFETLAVLLIYLGLEVGLDLALRLLDALGLGVDSGPAGLAVVTAGIVAVVFAFGTLVYTVMAIAIAPQVVMFVGLTHATIGLDGVRPGGRDDPEATGHRRKRPFRTWTRPMLGGFVIGALGLALAVSRYLD
jgi:hypothetical protein